jgi:hypothetical protein
MIAEEHADTLLALPEISALKAGAKFTLKKKLAELQATQVCCLHWQLLFTISGICQTFLALVFCAPPLRWASKTWNPAEQILVFGIMSYATAVAS